MATEANTAIIVGAGRGFGRATALAVIGTAGWDVVALARNGDDLRSLAAEAGPRVTTATGDARDRDLADRLLAEHRPASVLIGGGVAPHMARLEDQTWQSLSLHWDADVAIAFTWLQACLAVTDGSLQRVVALSSGAALKGSLGSGGYSGAKATTRWLTLSAAESSRERDLGITFMPLLPQLTSDTDLGRTAVGGYAELAGGSAAVALEAAPPYTAADAGRVISELLTGAREPIADTMFLGPQGLFVPPS